MNTEKIKSFFKEHWKTFFNVFIYAVLIIIIIMLAKCNGDRKEYYTTNIAALTDSIHVQQLKNDNLLYSQRGYIGKIQDLENQLNITNKEKQEIEKKLGSAITTIANLEGNIRVDSIALRTDTVFLVSDSVMRSNFVYIDDYAKIFGHNNFTCTSSQQFIDSLTMNVPIVIGTTEDYQWFVRTDNPYIHFTDIQGTTVKANKPKRWSIGPYIGIGVGFGGCFGFGNSYNNINNTGFIYGVTFGIAIHYDLFQW